MRKLGTFLLYYTIEYEDIYEGEFAVRRAITYTLRFSMKTLYGPVTEQKVIKKVITDIYADTNTATAPRNVRYNQQNADDDRDGVWYCRSRLHR